MTEAQVEMLRRSILILLSRNRTRFGLSADAVKVLLVEFGFDIPPEDVLFQLEYLEGKQFVQCHGAALNPKNRTWKITSTGVDNLP